MTEDDLTLKDQMSRLNQNFEQLLEKKETKKFKLPFKARVSKKKAKDGYSAICHINENREVKFLKAPISEGAVMVDGVPHLATTDYMLTYKNKPFLIVPSWSTKPFSPEESYDNATKEKNTTVGYRLLLNLMKMDAIKAKKPISWGLIIILLLILGVGGYYLMSSGVI